MSRVSWTFRVKKETKWPTKHGKYSINLRKLWHMVHFSVNSDSCRLVFKCCCSLCSLWTAPWYNHNLCTAFWSLQRSQPTTNLQQRYDIPYFAFTVPRVPKELVCVVPKRLKPLTVPLTLQSSLAGGATVKNPDLQGKKIKPQHYACWLKYALCSQSCLLQQNLTQHESLWPGGHLESSSSSSLWPRAW